MPQLTQPRIKWETADAARGREVSIRLRVEVNELRAKGKEPLRIWLSKAVADSIHACWHEVCMRRGVSYYDGTLPAIAGVPLKVGMTGGADYAIEMYANQSDEDDLMKKRGFKVSDNPLHGTH